MSDDPNGMRWSNAADNFGKNLLKKSGWTEGTGIGKSQEGVTTHVRVSRKDDVTGLGYAAGVQESWSVQSVGFADVLDKIKGKRRILVSDSDDGEEHASSIRKKQKKEKSGSGSDDADAVTTDTSVKVSRHYKMYSKRNNLKTELLRGENDDTRREEILGSAAHAKRAESGTHTSRATDEQAAESTLRSPVLKRLMVRCGAHEPKPTTEEEKNLIRVVKPNPKPPKCTESPFMAQPVHAHK